MESGVWGLSYIDCHEDFTLLLEANEEIYRVHGNGAQIMKVKKPYYLFVFYIVTSIACNAISGPSATEIPQAEVATQVPPPVASGNGPREFSAEATSADSVKLSWQAVDGATSYHIAVTTNGGAAFTVIDLPPSMTEYEDFLVAPDSQLTYVVEAVGDSTSIGQSVASVSTPARQPNPLQVLVEFDTSAAVSQKIGPAGGIISVLDSSGISYELSIPPNALEQETDISLIPLSDLSEWPLDGEMIGAVGMEPEGLVLNAPALLTITPPSATVPDGFATVGFSFQGYGDEFALRPVNDSAPESSYLPAGSAHLARPNAQFMDAVRQFLSQLRPTGAGNASPPRIKELAKNNPPSDPTAAFDQKETASLTSNADDPAPLPYLPWKRRYDTFQRRIQQVSECGQLTNSITYLVETRNQAEKAKDQTHNTAVQDAEAMDALLEKTKDVLDKAGEECKEKKKEDSKFTSAPCALKLLRNIASGASSVHKELQTRMLETFGKDVLENSQFDIRNSCKPGFVMVGGAEGMKVRDLVCDITEEFSVRGSVYGGAITLTFSPNSAEEGVLPGGGYYSYVGGGAGVSASGNGTFTFSGSLDTTVYIQAEGPGQAAGESGFGSENYTLTPVGYACGGGN